jgi:hypothetical protein
MAIGFSGSSEAVALLWPRQPKPNSKNNFGMGAFGREPARTVTTSDVFALDCRVGADFLSLLIEGLVRTLVLAVPTGTAGSSSDLLATQAVLGLAASLFAALPLAMLAKEALSSGAF